MRVPLFTRVHIFTYGRTTPRKPQHTPRHMIPTFESEHTRIRTLHTQGTQTHVPLTLTSPTRLTTVTRTNLHRHPRHPNHTHTQTQSFYNQVRIRIEYRKSRSVRVKGLPRFEEDLTFNVKVERGERVGKPKT